MIKSFNENDDDEFQQKHDDESSFDETLRFYYADAYTYGDDMPDYTSYYNEDDAKHTYVGHTYYMKTDSYFTKVTQPVWQHNLCHVGFHSTRD